jgi:Domain of unknown function (DUF4129)
VRSRRNRRHMFARTLLIVVVSIACWSPLRADTPSPSPTREEIARAIAAVQADPKFGGVTTIKTLKWKTPDTPKPATPETPEWMRWIAGFFNWMDQSARVIVWGGVIVVAVLLARFIIRLVGTRRPSRHEEAFIAPTHVRDLDIRPESLPPDIGAAARALWDRGEHRAALALLYRGLLSRLAHVHRMPIRDSSTEGDCLLLVAQRFPAKRGEYASRLVRVWQRAVYGSEDVQSSTVYMLCEDFATMLDRGLDRGAPDAGGAA